MRATTTDWRCIGLPTASSSGKTTDFPIERLIGLALIQVVCSCLRKLNGLPDQPVAFDQRQLTPTANLPQRRDKLDM